MPRPKRPGAPEPKRRSRKGCWPCKARKVKCGEEKPACVNCLRQGEHCDYSIRLNWDGRTKRKAAEPATPMSNSSMVMFQTSFQNTSQTGGADSLSPSDQVTLPVNTDPVHTEWDPDASLRFQGTMVQDAHSAQTSPVTPASIFGNSPARSEHQTSHNRVSMNLMIAENGFSQSSQTEPMMSLQNLSDPSSHFEITSSHRSPSPSFSSPSDPTILGSRIGYFPPLGFGNHSVSQPTSFLRETLQDHTSQGSTTVEQNQPHRAKRHKDASHILNEEILNDCYPQFSAQMVAQETTALNSLNSPDDLRRVSVNSLLSESADMASGTGKLSNSSELKEEEQVVGDEDIDCGLDCGYRDYDLNKNDDSAAIEPAGLADAITGDFNPSSVGDRGYVKPRRKPFFTAGRYYSTPVQMNVPRHLTPLPSTLQQNPINLMYFHHFINHTARILVPHDCEENPFISVLPGMAITNPNLLNLMLAYSASHRARFLRHPEPSNRIAHWVSDVFPALRQALHDPEGNVTDSHLATAIMLLSLKIVSPSTFEVPITWQSHLKLARDLFVARGVHHMANPSNKVAFFLARWFGYLDVQGSLSCRRSGPPLLKTNYWSPTLPDSLPNEDDYFRVDCFGGYTPRTGDHLARLGHLTHRCDNERFDEVGNFLPDWSPSDDIVLAAETLLEDMQRARARGHVSGTHHTEQENWEMMAIDLAFHWSAVLHIHRRVLGRTAFSSDVHDAIDQLCTALGRIRPGSSTEVSVLFPLFTAGCEIQDPGQRLEVMTRVMNFEAEGLKQIKNARKLMQRCWEEDLPWIALAHGEFLG